jgi:hypothetical protein
MPLRIPLRVTEEEPPFVTAQAYWLRKGTKDRIDFLVDTGAWDITISEDNARSLGARLNELPRSRLSIGGVGGKATLFEMDDVMLQFNCEGGKSRDVLLRSVQITQNPNGKKGRQGTAHIPSLLGRGFMKRNRIVLYWDFDAGIAHLDVKSQGCLRTGVTG